MVMVGLLRAACIIVGMTVNEILAQLKSLGDDARRAHNTKAGAPDNQFGVKLGDIRAMAKKIISYIERKVEARRQTSPERRQRCS